jgi:uncharacterized Ntn-hydrolase superfamily protein
LIHSCLTTFDLDDQQRQRQVSVVDHDGALSLGRKLFEFRMNFGDPPQALDQDPVTQR